MIGASANIILVNMTSGIVIGRGEESGSSSL